MSLKVIIPNNFIPERKYSLDMTISNFLGLKYEIEVDPNISNYQLVVGDKFLNVEDCFFSKYDEAIGYLNKSNIPNTCLFFTDIRWIPEKNLPILFGCPKLEISESEVNCSIDIFATIFFFLSRWEEVVVTEKDEHFRFPSIFSYAGRFSLIDRPIVDEYIEFLRNILRYLGIEKFGNKTFQVQPSCDVDWPYDPIYYSNFKLIKTLGGDIIKRKSIKDFSRHINNQLTVNKNGYQSDPNYTFDFLMDCCEKYGLRNSFYFIAGHSAGEIDGVYNLNMPMIQRLLKVIDSRGHEIGIHFSYNAFKDTKVMQSELDNLRNTLKQLELKSEVKGGRQHFLRWETPKTPNIWNELGLSYDSTLGYADHVGFRSGTSHSYLIYDPLERRQLELVENPLILMECSAISERYMGMGYSEEAIQYMLNIKDVVKKYKGKFTVLWHNSHFNHPMDFVFFEELVK